MKLEEIIFGLRNANEFPWNYEEVSELAIDLLERTRWIPVSERLPEKNGQYLVYSGWVRTLLCLYGEWACDPKESPVTHWMTLPEPPKEVE